MPSGESISLTRDPIPELLWRIATPASVGMFFQTMYNVVDTYFGGLVSTQAQAGLALSFPVFFIIIATGVGLGQGTTALVSNALGRDDKEEAMLYAAQAVTFGLIMAVAVTALGLFLSPHLLGLLGAKGEYLVIARDYLDVILLGALFFIITHILNGSLVAAGDTRSFRNFLILGFLLNLILDPWFLWGGFGLPAFGFKGIAWATVAIQFVGTVYLFWRVWKTGVICKGCGPLFWPRKDTFKNLAKQGFPASLNMMTIAVGIFITTYFISWFGKVAVAAYGIATRIEQIALLPTIGLNTATLTLVGQNFGASKFDRIRLTYAKAIQYGATVMVVGAIGVYGFAGHLMEIFSDDAAVVEIGSVYLRIAVFIFIAYIVIFISVALLQGLKRPMFAIWIGVYRQILAPAVIFYLFAITLGWGLHGIWWGVFAVTWSGAVITLLYTWRVMRNLGE